MYLKKVLTCMKHANISYINEHLSDISAGTVYMF